MTMQSERCWVRCMAGGVLVLALELGCSGAATENGSNGGSPGAAESGPGTAGRRDDGQSSGPAGGSKGWREPVGSGGTGVGPGETEPGGSGAGGGWAGDGGTYAAGGWAGDGGTYAAGGAGGWGDSHQGGSQGGTAYTGGNGTGGSSVDAALLCADEYKNGRETDIDCGGPDCTPCPAASSCTQHKDCKSSVCRGMTCQSPSCDDEVKNGSEASIDCGGSCEPCP